MLKMLFALFGAKRTVDTIVAGLKQIEADLREHVALQSYKADDHTAEAEHHTSLADLAKAEAAKAAGIAENIGRLLGA